MHGNENNKIPHSTSSDDELSDINNIRPKLKKKNKIIKQGQQIRHQSNTILRLRQASRRRYSNIIRTTEIETSKIIVEANIEMEAGNETTIEKTIEPEKETENEIKENEDFETEGEPYKSSNTDNEEELREENEEEEREERQEDQETEDKKE